MATRAKRKHVAVNGPASPGKQKREQHNVLGSDAAEVAASYSNVRDILGVTNEQMLRQPNNIGTGVFDAVKALANLVSTMDFRDGIVTPQAKDLRGWVKACKFLETACRFDPVAVAHEFARLCREGCQLLDGEMHVIAQPLLRWTCGALGLDDEEDLVALRKKLANINRVQEDVAAAADAMEAVASADVAPAAHDVNDVNMLTEALSDDPSNIGEEVTGAADDKEEGVGEETPPDSEQLCPPAAVDEDNWIVLHEEVAAAGDVNSVAQSAEGEMELMKCATSAPRPHVFFVRMCTITTTTSAALTTAITAAMSQEDRGDVAGALA